jgi:hypothetical protein
LAGPRTIPFNPDIGRNSEAQEEVLPLAGASLLVLSKRPIPADKTLLGDRWLCAGGGAMIVGPSGIGKSTLSVQAAALWSCGRSAFGIRPARPLRLLVIQSEDDDGDSIEMARVLNELGLSEKELELTGRNTHLEFLNDKTGHAFTKRLNEMLGLFPCDIVVVNPLSAYLGSDTKDEEKVNQFLRTWINPILTTHNTAVIFIHHTPKTTNRDTSEWTTEWMYSGSGVAGITNWARAYIAIDPCKEAPDVYKFIAAKRGKRIGWGGSETFWAHSRDDGKILWVPADRDQIALAKEASKSNPDDLLRLVPELDPISQEKLHQIASEKKIGEKKIRRFLKILEEEKKIYRHKMPREGAKAAIGYSKTPSAQEGE